MKLSLASERRMQLEPFQYYLARRRLRWAGHTSHMQFTRLPHMFLSSWVDNKWSKQRPQFSYGHGLSRDLKNAEIHEKAWNALASDCNLWHAMTQQKNVHHNSWAVASLCKIKLQHCLLHPLTLVSYLARFYLAVKDIHHIKDICPFAFRSPAKSTLSCPSPVPFPSLPSLPPPSPPNAPLVRCSRSLVAEAELTGGRRVYNSDDRRLKPCVFP